MLQSLLGWSGEVLVHFAAKNPGTVLSQEAKTFQNYYQLLPSLELQQNAERRNYFLYNIHSKNAKHNLTFGGLVWRDGHLRIMDFVILRQPSRQTQSQFQAKLGDTEPRARTMLTAPEIGANLGQNHLLPNPIVT